MSMATNTLVSNKINLHKQSQTSVKFMGTKLIVLTFCMSLFQEGFKQKPLTINHRLTMPVVYEFNKAVVSLFN